MTTTMIENLKKQLELILEKFDKNDTYEKDEKNDDKLNASYSNEIPDEDNQLSEVDTLKEEVNFLKEEVSILSAELLHVVKALEAQQTMLSKLYQVNLKLMSAISPGSEENDIFKKNTTKKDYKPN